MLSTPRLASSSSRTTRVIEELQENLENIQKELENTRAQLQTVKENKESSERENEENIESNKQIRIEIQQVMQVLESKQQLLESTKETSVNTENKVKQLKDEAMNARKELNDLKRREYTIDKERHLIQQEKEKQIQAQKTFKDSVAQTQADCDKEIKELESELTTIQQAIQKIKNQDIEKEVQEMMEKQVKERKVVIKNFENIQKEIELNNQNFVIQVKQELVQLLDQLSKNEEDVISTEIDNCKSDVNTLVSRIKSNAAIALNDQ